LILAAPGRKHQSSSMGVLSRYSCPVIWEPWPSKVGLYANRRNWPLCTIVMPVWKGYRPKFVLFARRRVLLWLCLSSVIRLLGRRSFPQKIRSALVLCCCRCSRNFGFHVNLDKKGSGPPQLFATLLGLNGDGDLDATPPMKTAGNRYSLQLRRRGWEVACSLSGEREPFCLHILDSSPRRKMHAILLDRALRSLGHHF
jgi:hypothetical protein